METINQLMQQSVGVGAGIALGSAVGFAIRKKRTGSGQGLVAGSVFVTSAICGLVAMSAMMLLIWLGVF
ncbi:hypothetical protein [Shimia sp.]|uniref:hypothetical protein n=1 Tax=Shimia sp. TaxID=1954381 RepID=UPI003566B2AE